MSSQPGPAPAADPSTGGPAEAVPTRPGSARVAVGTLKAAFTRFQDDSMTDHAAALTYYSLMSLFPALLVGVALFGLLGQASTVSRIARYLTDHGVDASTVHSIRTALSNGINGGGASLAFVLGILVALYGAAGAFGAAGRALNVVLRAEEDRGFVHRKISDLGSTALVIVLALLAMILVFLGGGVASDLFGTIGLGSTAATVWNIVRWPAAIVVAMTIYAYVYYAAPDVTGKPWRWISPGAVAGVLIWILASAAFFFYVANFGSYNKTYGTFATAVILLVWLWLTNVAMLFGAELNAAIDERGDPGDDFVARAIEEAPRGA
jgi:membrane protein